MIAAAAWLLLAAPLSAEMISPLGVEEPPAQADLAQCYAWAKEQSESLRGQKEQIYQIEQQFKQALAAALPNLSFNGSEKWQDTSGAGDSGNSFLFINPQPQVNFALSQPIFSGFREYAAMSFFKHQGQATELQLRHAEVSLYQDVANAFYLVLNLEKQLANAQSAVELTSNRVGELRRFEDLGKSRHSEVTLVESQEATNQALVESLRGQIEVALDVLSFLTGRNLNGTALIDRLDRIRSLEPEESALGRAYDRTDVRSLHKLIEVQQDNVKLAKGTWYPTVSFLGNYYLRRIDLLQPIHWDAAVSGSLPIFQGGGQLAALRQAKSQASQAQLNFELGLRQARSNIHQTYVVLRAAVAQTQAAEKAFQKADETLRLQLKEYRLGLVNNLDVLTAMNTLIGAKTAFDQLVIQSKLDLLLLKASYEDVQ